MSLAVSKAFSICSFSRAIAFRGRGKTSARKGIDYIVIILLTSS